MVYMSPERIDGAKYSFASDIWSFGRASNNTCLMRKTVNTVLLTRNDRVRDVYREFPFLREANLL